LIVCDVSWEELDTSSDPYDPLEVPKAIIELELRSVDQVIVAFFVVIDPAVGPDVRLAAVKYFPVGVLVMVEETAEQFEALSQALTQ